MTRRAEPLVFFIDRSLGSGNVPRGGRGSRRPLSAPTRRAWRRSSAARWRSSGSSCVERIYERLLLPSVKKRYAGVLADGTVEIVGFEVVRGDWAQVAHVCRVIADLRARRPVRRPDRVETLTRRPSNYEARGPHVAAAERLARAGPPPRLGDRIGYVVVEGPGAIADRAIPAELTRPESIDAEYDLTHQVVPAALRALEWFGVAEGDLR